MDKYSYQNYYRKYFQDNKFKHQKTYYHNKPPEENSLINRKLYEKFMKQPYLEYRKTTPFSLFPKNNVFSCEIIKYKCEICNYSTFNKEYFTKKHHLKHEKLI